MLVGEGGGGVRGGVRWGQGIGTLKTDVFKPSSEDTHAVHCPHAGYSLEYFLQSVGAAFVKNLGRVARQRPS